MDTGVTSVTPIVRKIIHVDLDCFYAAVEMRDNPALINQPVAVGGIGERSVICTCNYLARSFGVHSAMSSKLAKSKCSNLIILPVDMAKYRDISKQIHKIFYEFTQMVEPVALDEAYLDVSASPEFNNSATFIAGEIRRRIFAETALTASAGVASNKFLAKIASNMNKPDGLCVITPNQVAEFIKMLAVAKIPGVGKVTLSRLQQLKITNCGDLQRYALKDLINYFGKFGARLYYFSRGIDDSEVLSNRERKSLSVEITFIEDIAGIIGLLSKLRDLYPKLLNRIQVSTPDYVVKNQFIKLKFSDYKVKTLTTVSNKPDLFQYELLLRQMQIYRPIRLLGIGVSFYPKEESEHLQSSLFD